MFWSCGLLKLRIRLQHYCPAAVTLLHKGILVNTPVCGAEAGGSASAAIGFKWAALSTNGRRTCDCLCQSLDVLHGVQAGSLRQLDGAATTSASSAYISL
jgi:hypothetical protein